MNRIMKALVFDMDGLMIDSERLYIEAECDIAAQFGRTVEDRLIGQMMGCSPLESMRIFQKELNLPISPEELLEKRQRRVEDGLRKEVVPMKGLFEIINEFHGTLKLAIVTGSPGKFVEIVVDRLHIRDRFDIWQSSEEISRGKPDPEIYLTNARKLDLKPDECIVLEDSHNGALAAVRAGCVTIAVPNIYTREQDFSFVHHVAEDLLDARDYISLEILGRSRDDTPA